MKVLVSLALYTAVEGHCLSGSLEPAPALLAAIHQELAKVRADLLEYREDTSKAPSIPH